MEKINFKKTILVLSIIISMIAPMVCSDVVYAVDNLTENSIASPETSSTESTEQENNTTNDAESDNKENENKSGDTDNKESAENQTTSEETASPEATNIEEPEADVEGQADVEEQEDEQVEKTSTIDTTQQLFSINENGEIVVKAVDGALQEAINSANNGNTLILEGDRYRNGNQPIDINKSLTIKSTRNSVISDEVQIKQTNVGTNIILEGITLGFIRASEGHDCLDIQSPVNLTMKNVRLADIGGSSIEGANKPSIINIAKEANGTQLNILEGCEILGCYDGIRVKSSNTTVNIEGSKVLAEIALKMEDGSGNNIKFEDSEINTGSSITSEYEGISIDKQIGLTITINNSKVIGTGIGGSKYEDTKLFSIDEDSNNVNLSITGNSTIELQKTSAKNCIFNFGNNFEDSNTVHVASTVVFPIKKVSERYNTSNNYYVVGIYDENGNLDVKSYNKNVNLTLEELPAKTGYRFEKWMYKTGEEEEGTEFKQPYNVTNNMEVYPQYIETVDVQIEEKTYTIDKGQKLNDLDESKRAEARGKVEELKQKVTTAGKTFREFVDSATGDVLKDVDAVMEHAISQDTQIIATYNNALTVGGETFILPNEAKTLSQLMEMQEYAKLKEVVESLKNVDGKGFKEFQNQNGHKVDEEDTPIDEDTVLTPKYTVDLTIKKGANDKGTKYTIDENTTLSDLKDSEQEGAKELLDELSGEQKTKKFSHFETEDGTKIEDETPIEKHTTIMPKYTVKVTIKKNSEDKDGKEYELYEGQTLADLTETEKEEMREYVDEDKKEFAGFANFNQSDAITENIELTPIYNVTVTIKAQDGNKVFVIREGKKLSDIANQTAFKATKVKGTRKFLGFAYIDADKTEKIFDEENATINQDIELTPIFGVKVTIKGNPEEFYVEEGKTIVQLASDEKFEEAKQKEGRIFSRFVYLDDAGQEQTLTNDYELNEDIELTPKYNVTITIKAVDRDKTFIIEEGKLLSEAVGFEETKNKADRIFSRFVYTDTDGTEKTWDEATPVMDNMTLTPIFAVTVTINKADGTTLKVYPEEGKTLNDLTEEEKQKLSEIESTHGENEKFAGFVNVATEKLVSKDEPINENITLEATYEENIPTPPTSSPDEGDDQPSTPPTSSPEQSGNGETGNDSEVTAPEQTGSVTETETTNIESTTPTTSDNIAKYIIGEFIAIICIVGAAIKIKKNKQ